MRLVDANVLLYAVNERAVQHETAKAWLDRSLVGAETIGFTWNACLAFLRVATHPRVFARPLSSDDATSVVREWLAAPAAMILEPTQRHVDIVGDLLRDSGVGGNLVNDAHLAALALEHDATVVSFDTDFVRFSKVAWERPSI